MGGISKSIPKIFAIEMISFKKIIKLVKNLHISIRIALKLLYRCFGTSNKGSLLKTYVFDYVFILDFFPADLDLTLF